MKYKINHYTKEEIAYLIKYYKFDGMHSVAAALDRTPLAVARKYCDLRKKGLV